MRRSPRPRHPGRHCPFPAEPSPPEGPRGPRRQRPDESDGNAMNDLTQLRDFGRDLEHDLKELSPALRNRILSSFGPRPRRERWLRQQPRNTPLRRRLPIPVGVLATLTAAVVCLNALGFWGG